MIGQDRESLSGSQEKRNAGMAYETTAAGRHKNPFLLSSLPAFLRGSGAMVVEAILFGCGYAALGNHPIIRRRESKERGCIRLGLLASDASTEPLVISKEIDE